MLDEEVFETVNVDRGVHREKMGVRSERLIDLRVLTPPLGALAGGLPTRTFRRS